MKNPNVFSVMKLIAAALVGVIAWAGYVAVGAQVAKSEGPKKNKTVKGNGMIKTESRNVQSFTSLDLASAFMGEVTEGKTASLQIIADSNLMPYVKHKLEGGRLSISMEGSYSYDKPIRVIMTTPILNKLDVSGASQLVVKNMSSHPLGFVCSGAAKVSVAGTPNAIDGELSGASELKLGNVTLNFLKLDLSGASKFIANGSAASANISASGASMMTGSFTVKKGRLETSGASSINVSSDSQVKKSSSGASSIGGSN
jgi:Putative auto-transporter adhesin, head GIN domain